MTAGSPGTRRRRPHPETLVLALLAYLPALLSSPGAMPADTKLGLYLDPGRLMAGAHRTWDPGLFGGWVPHQMVAYLWPSGPWYWVAAHLGVPVWVAHRLWIGTLLVAAGAGVRWLAGLLGLRRGPAVAAALTYQCSPYLLAYISRTSVMLLPWAALGWLTGLSGLAVVRRRWREPALIGLIVLTVGAVNATALLMVVPAPVLLLAHLGWQRLVPRRQVLMAAGRIALIGVLASMWWLVMVVIQRRYGADVLAYSETLTDVSRTATSTEALRGLGYWLFYVGDAYARTTTAAPPYMTNPALILAGWSLVVGAVAGLAASRWRWRGFAALCITVGVILAVGPHPLGHPSLLWRALGDGSLSLAIRSSTRAVPVVLLGASLGLGAGLTALSGAHRHLGRLAGVMAAVLAVLNLPALWQARLVDPALRRDARPPDAWRRAAAILDSTDRRWRVLQLPGQEFGAFAWGYTVDPPLASLTHKPLITRDLLPLGSAGLMDLLYALDDRIQEGTAEPTAIAPLARMLGADTIWLTQDLDAARFRTPAPGTVRRLIAAAGLGPITDVGAAQPPSDRFPTVDEHTVADPPTDLAPVALVTVPEPRATGGTSTRQVVVIGSGDGVVDAAASGLLDGTEAVAYAAAHQPSPPAQLVVLTDSNRDRARQWRGSQDVHGYTSGPGLDPLVPDPADARLPTFPDQQPADRTTTELAGGVTVRATGYGEPYAYRPEDRPAMAVDGDPSTAWLVADRADPVGQAIEVAGTDAPLVLRQAATPGSTRRIAEVRVEWTSPAPGSRTVVLDARSDTPAGQPVDGGAGTRRVVITRVEARPGGTDSGPSAVGFAELGPVALETVDLPRVPAGIVADDTPLAVVLTRLRIDPLDRWRDDPERAIVRRFTLPVTRTFGATVTLRADRRVGDAVLNALGGRPTVVASGRMAGSLQGGWAAVDGNPATAWTTPFGQARGSTLTITRAGTAPVSALTVRQPVDGRHSPITRLTVTDQTGPVAVEVPAAGADGISAITLSRPLRGTAITVTVDAVEARSTIDRRYGEPVELPAAIDELVGLGPLAPTAPAPAGCRSDLVTLDGEPLGIEVTPADLARLADGETVTAPWCSPTPLALRAGDHVARATPASSTGIDVDRLVLTSGDVRPAHRGGTVALAAWQVPAAPGGGVQALADIVLVLTAALAAVLLIVVIRQRNTSAAALTAARLRAEPAWRGWRGGPPDPLARRASTAAVLVALGALVCGSLGFAATLTVALAVLLSRRTRWLWSLLTAVTVMQGLILVVAQIHDRWAPNGFWPGSSGTLHQTGLVIVVVLAAAVLGPAISRLGAAPAPRRRPDPSG